MISSHELFGNEKSPSEYILESLREQDKMVEELKKLSIKERQFRVFKMFYNDLDESKKEILQAAVKKYPSILDKTFSFMHEANNEMLYKTILTYNREETYSDVMFLYKSLLKKISKLSQELNINNSLELSILFSYLLWNGYLSKGKTYRFESKNRKKYYRAIFCRYNRWNRSMSKPQ